MNDDVGHRDSRRKEKYCTRQIVRDGVPCKGVEGYWMLLPEEDEAIGDAAKVAV